MLLPFIVVKKDRVTGVEFIKCLSVFDEQGRFSPKFDEEKKLSIETGCVVESISQGKDNSYISEIIHKQPEFTPSGQLAVLNVIFPGDVLATHY